MSASPRRARPAAATEEAGAAAAAFERILKRQLSLPGTEATRMFGSTGMKVDGKVFAMLVKNALVVKLPAARAEALVAAGRAVPFDPGHGRVMKEWVALSSGRDSWGRIASEARSFVAGKTPGGKK